MSSFKVDPHAFDSFRDYANHVEETRNKYYNHLINRPENFDKPTVYYTGKAEFYELANTEVARVHAVDHPFWGNDILRTSAVLKKWDNGIFETRNTVYIPVGNEEMGS